MLNQRLAAILGVMLMFSSCVVPCRAEAFPSAEFVCATYAGVVREAVRLGRQGDEVDDLIRRVRAAIRRQSHVAELLADSIAEARQHPDRMMEVLDNGAWERSCVIGIMTN